MLIRFSEYIGILFSGVISLFGVLVWGWQIQDMAALFIGESVLVAIFQTYKMSQSGLEDKKVLLALAFFGSLIAGFGSILFSLIYPPVEDYYFSARGGISNGVWFSLIISTIFLLKDTAKPIKKVPVQYLAYPVFIRLVSLLLAWFVGSYIVAVTNSATGFLLALLGVHLILQLWVVFKLNKESEV